MNQAPNKIETTTEVIGDCTLETQRSAELPNSQVRIIVGKSRDKVMLLAERLSSEAEIANFGRIEQNRDTGEYRLIGATTGSIAKSYVGTAVGFAIAALVMFCVTQAEARPKKIERTCNSYQWCLDWSKRPSCETYNWCTDWTRNPFYGRGAR